MNQAEIDNHIRTAERFLRHAEEQFEIGDMPQASEKAWGAAALMVKAVAQARGEVHYAHPFLSRLVDDLADEIGDERLSRLFDAAESLHTNFYENRFRAMGVRRRLRDVEEFVETMERILNVHNP